MAEIVDPKKQAARQVYENIDGEGKGYKYEDFEKLMLSDGGYRKKVFDNFGGEQSFGPYNDYNGFFEVEEKKKNVVVPPTPVVPANSGVSSEKPLEPTPAVEPEKNFEKRIKDPSLKIQNADGTVSTHKMASAEVDGKQIAYPTIVEKGGKLVELNDKDALDYALKNNEFKEFKTEKEAQEYAEGGYKKGTPLEQKNDTETPLLAELSKLELGQFDKVDMTKVIDYYKGRDESPSASTLGKIKEYAEVKTKGVADQVAKMETLGTALESANADLEGVKQKFPELEGQLKELDELQNKKDPTVGDQKRYKELFEQTTIARGVLDQRQKVAKKIFEQYDIVHNQVASDIKTLQGVNSFYEGENYWYDKTKSLGENISSDGRSLQQSMVMAQAKILKQFDALSTMVADATGLKKSGIFGKLADKLQTEVKTSIDQNDDVPTIANKIAGGVGGLVPMFTELMLTPELKIKAVAVPKFVTYMAYSTALDKFDARIDELETQFKKPYESLPLDIKIGAYGELAKGGAIGAGEGALLHALNLGAMRYGGSMLARAGLGGTVFAGYDAIKQKIETGEINDKDIIASFILGAGMSLHGEISGGGDKTKERVGAVKDFWDSAMKAPEQSVKGPLIDAYLKTRPDLAEQLQKIQNLATEGERVKAAKDLADKAMAEMPDQFKRDFFESNDVMTGDEFDFIKINRDEAGKNSADLEAATPKGVFDMRNLINKYNLKQDFKGLKNFVSDGLAVEATPAELLEIKAIMKDNFTDFVRAKSAGEAVGFDPAEWDKKLNQIFGGNGRLLDVLGKMNSRQRALLLAKLLNTTEAEILGPDGEPTGEKAEIPVEGGGKFKVTLAEKIMHALGAKSLKDIYGFNYNSEGSNSSRTFWQMSRESNRAAMSNDNMADAENTADDMRTEADFEQDADVAQNKRVVSQFIQQVVNINREAGAIAANPEKYIAAIRDDNTLSQNEKDTFYKMVDDVMMNKGAIAAQAAIIAQDIEKLNEDLNSLPEGKSLAEIKAITENITEQIEKKEQEIKDLYASYVPAKEVAATLPEEEFTPEQEAKITKAVSVSPEFTDEAKDILRIKNKDKRAQKLSEFKKKVLAEAEKAPVSDIEAKKADIERRRKEELKRRKAKGFAIKKYVADGENQLLLDEDAELAAYRFDKIIENGIKNGKTAEQIQISINNGYAFDLGATNETIRNYIQDRIDGKTTQSFNEFRQDTHKETNAKYDAELAALEKPVEEVKPVEPAKPKEEKPVVPVVEKPKPVKAGQLNQADVVADKANAIQVGDYKVSATPVEMPDGEPGMTVSIEKPDGKIENLGNVYTEDVASEVNKKVRGYDLAKSKPAKEKPAPKADIESQKAEFDKIAPSDNWGTDEHGRLYTWLKNTGQDESAELIRNLDPKDSRQIYLVNKLKFEPDGEQQAKEVLKSVEKAAKPPKARKPLDDLFDELDSFNVNEEAEPYNAPEVKAEQIAVGQKLIKALINDPETPIHKFDDMLAHMVERYGEDRAMRNFDAIKMAYGAFLAVAPDDITNQMTELRDLKKFKPADILKKIQDNGNTNLADAGSDNTPGVDGGVEQTETDGAGSDGPVEAVSTDSGGTSDKVEGGGDTPKPKRSGSKRNSNGINTSAGGGSEPGSGDNERAGVGKDNASLAVEDQDHVITPSESIVPKGETAKINANIDAIKLLQKLDAENRNPTPEEKNTLARFTGWGGFGEVLNRDKYAAQDPNWMKRYGKLHEQIAALLTDSELTAAINSTISSHYTPKEIISNVWNIIQGLGFKGGNILESSAGIGHFFGLMPADIHTNSSLIGYELDNIAGRILKKLYPQANIRVQGFEFAKIAPNSVDLTVSNVPFGRTAPYDAANPELSKFNLHNYFIAKNISLLKPGGIGVFITSSSTMDNGGGVKFREWVTREGNSDFVGAIRLPNNAFKENAGTEVTTDILIFRKRTTDQPSSVAKEFRYTKPIRTVEVDGQKKDIEVNDYFADNPDMMLGEMKLASEAGSGGLYRADSQTLQARPGQNTELDLQQAISKLPKDIFGAKVDLTRKTEFSDITDKMGTLKVKDGKVYQVSGGELQPVEWNGQKIKAGKKDVPVADVVKQYVDIKDRLGKLLNAELDPNASAADIEALRAGLKAQYDDFTSKYGTLNKPGRANKLKFLEDDVEFDATAALETVNFTYETNEAGKSRRVAEIVPSQILSSRVNYPIVEPETAKDPADAVLISLSYKNRIDIDYIGKLLGLLPEAVTGKLLSEGLAFEDPATGLLESKDTYLSGFVRDKLKLAEAAALTDPKYATNVAELEKIIPADMPPLLIKFKLGSPWMPPQVIKDWARETLGVDVDLAYSKQTSSWAMSKASNTGDARNRSTWGTNDFTGWELVEKALNMGQPTVSRTIKNADGSKTTVKDIEATAAAQAKQAELMDNFVNWVRDKGTYDEEISKIYNETYNSYVERKYSMPIFEHYPGAATVDKRGQLLKLRQHQMKAVQRILQDSVLLAHQVGTGKTFTMITAAMEMKRLGRARKPLIIVQNATVGQFADAFRELYPTAKILVPSAQQRDAKNRRKLFAMIAYNDWDSVIIPQSFASFIPDDPDRVNAYIQEQIDDLMATMADIDDGSYESSFRVRELEKELEKLEEMKSRGSSDGYINEVKNLINDLRTDGTPEALQKATELGFLVDEYAKYAEKKGLSREEKTKALTTIVGQAKSAIESSSTKIKDIARQQLSIEKGIRKQSDRRTDEVLTFEKTGIDAMFYDEAHANKKLGFYTKMSNIKGIDTGRSQRAFSTFMKTRWIQELNQGKNVVFATGTPITNTLAEVWTMMKFIQPDVLEKYNISSFDQFAATFGAVEPSLEFTAAGKFKMVERFKSYINAPELLTAFRSKTDVVLTEDIPEFKQDKTIPLLKPTSLNYVNGAPYFNGVPVNNITVSDATKQDIKNALSLLGNPSRAELLEYFTTTSPNAEAVEFLKRRGFTNVIIPQTPALKEQMDEFRGTMEWFEGLTGKQKRQNQHIPLLIFNQAKQAAIDLRLLKPDAIDDPGSKTNRVVADVLDIYKATAANLGTQLIFSDMYQSPEAKDKYLDEEQTILNPAYGKKRFNLYQDIKKKLIAGGIPENEIVIIHDLGSGKSADAKRARVFEQMKQGKIRIMLGSTEKMGIGVNVQDKMAAIHHVDAPNRPDQFEQRNGRGLRQGNELAYRGEDFDIRTYGVEGTLDATAYGRLGIKQKFSNQMMKGEGLDREMNDEADEDNPADMSFEQRMAALSGSQYAVLWHAKTFELRKLETASKNHDRRLIQLNSDLKNDKMVVDALKGPRTEEIEHLYNEVAEKFPENNIETLERDGVVTTDKMGVAMDSVIKGLIMKSVQDRKPHSEVVKLNGVPVRVYTFSYKFNAINTGVKIVPEDISVFYTFGPDGSYYSDYIKAEVGSGTGFLASFRSKLDFIRREKADIVQRIARVEDRIPVIQSELKKPFANQDKLTNLRAEVADIEEQMKAEVIDKKEEDGEKPVDEEPEEDVEASVQAYATDVSKEKAKELPVRLTPDKASIAAYVKQLAKSYEDRVFLDTTFNKLYDEFANFVNTDPGSDVLKDIAWDIYNRLPNNGFEGDHIDLAYGSAADYKEAIKSLKPAGPVTVQYEGDFYENGSIVQKKVSIRPSSVKESLDKKMAFDVVGAVIDSPETAADIFQSIRNPHMEVTAVVFLKNGKVVHSSFGSIGLPDAANFGVKADGVYQTSIAMGADEVMLVHNHPSGNPKVSGADKRVTNDFAWALDGTGVKFKGHVVVDTDKFSFINPTGGVEERQYKKPVENFHYERISLGDGNASENMLKLSDAILKQNNYKTAVVFLNSALQIQGFEPVSPGEMPKLAANALDKRIKYGASSYVIITDGETISGPFDPALVDIIDVKNKVQGVDKFPVTRFAGNTAKTGLDIINEDTAPYTKVEDMLKEEDKEKQIEQLQENINKMAAGLAKDLKVQEGFLIKSDQIAAKVKPRSTMGPLMLHPADAIKGLGVLSSRAFNAANKIDLGVINIPVQDFLSDKIIGNIEEFVAKAAQAAATSKVKAVRELSDIATGWLRGTIDNKDYVVDRGQMKGGIALGAEAANRMGKAIRAVVGNNPGSLGKVIAVMDPELHLHFGQPTETAYKSLSGQKATLYKDIYDARRTGAPTATMETDLAIVNAQIEAINNVVLTPEEKVVQNLLTTLNTITHDTNRMLNLASGGTMGISEETWEKFRNPVTGKADYIARSYSWVDDQDEAELLTRQIMAEMGMYMGRGDVTADKVLEAIKDPVYLTVKRYAQTMKNVAVFDYSQALFAEQSGKGVLTGAQFNAKFGTPPQGMADKGYVKLPGFGYGLLSNKWVAKHYAEDLKGFMYNTWIMSKFNDFAQAYDTKAPRRFFRTYFTVLNPGVVAGNIAMNYVWAFKAGINPFAFAGYLPKAIQEIKNGGPAYLAVLNNGLIGSNVELANLQGTAPTGKGFIASAKAFYGGVDDVAKIQAYLVLTDLNGYTPAEAIQVIRDSFQTSEEVGRYWDLAAKTPLIGNMFARFVAQAMRINKNNLAKRPLYTIAWYSFLAFITSALMSGDDEAEELSAEEKGVWQDFATSVPRSMPMLHYDSRSGGMKVGDIPLSLIVNGKRLDIGRFIETNYIWDQGNEYQSYIQWINKVAPFPLKGEKKDSGVRTLRFMYGDPILGPIMQTMEDQDFRMRSIQDPQSGPWGGNVNITQEDRMLNIAGYLARSYGGQYLALVDDIWNASRGEPDRYGRYKTISDSFLNLLIKVQRFDKDDVKKAVEKRMKSHDREFENLKGQINNTLDQYHKDLTKILEDDTRNPEQRDRAMKELTDQYYKANKDRYENVLEWMATTKQDIDRINTLANDADYSELQQVIKDFTGDAKFTPTMGGKRGQAQIAKAKQGKMEELKARADEAINVKQEEIKDLAEEEFLKGKQNVERARLIYEKLAGKDVKTQNKIIKNYVNRGVVTNQTKIYLNQLRKKKD